MPEMDGFQLLKKLQFRNFDLIITTAYDSYALKAFKESAIDYLLKPVDTDDLIKSVSKIKINKSKNVLGKELYQIIESITPKSSFSKVSLPLSGKTIFVNPNEILYCKSDGNYTEIYFENTKREVLSKKLKDVELIINNSLFYRVHNSYLVNINHVREFIRSDGQYLVLENGSTIPVSRSKRNTLLQLLNT
jgi:two-component system LytT family response regulator